MIFVCLARSFLNTGLEARHRSHTDGLFVTQIIIERYIYVLNQVDDIAAGSKLMDLVGAKKAAGWLTEVESASDRLGAEADSLAHCCFLLLSRPDKGCTYIHSSF